MAVDQLAADFTEASVEVQNCASFHYEAFSFVLGMSLNPKQINIKLKKGKKRKRKEEKENPSFQFLPLNLSHL